MDPVTIVLTVAGLALTAIGIHYARKSTLIAEREQHRRIETDRATGPTPPAVPPPKPSWPEIVSTGLSLDRHVVGRTEDAGRLRKMLTSEAGGVLGVVLKGLGGLGKSTLARHYVAIYGHKYRGIWWLRAETRETLIDDLCDLATVPVLKVEDTGGGRPALARAAVARLAAEPGPWLLVYDNAERANDIRRWRPDAGEVHLLVTSREGGWPGQYVTHDLDRLGTGEGVELLLQESEREGDREGAERLAAELDGLPLAIVNAGAWLRDTPSDSFDSYRERVEDLLRHRPATLADYHEGIAGSVYGSVKLSLDKLTVDDPKASTEDRRRRANAALLMKVFAWLAPDDLWPGLVSALAEKEARNEKDAIVPEALYALARNRAAIDHATAELARRSLVERKGETWRMHRLTQAVQRAILAEDQSKIVYGELRKADAGENWAAIAAAVVAAGYLNVYTHTFKQCLRLNPHITALDRLRGGSPVSEAMQFLYNQASIYYTEQCAFLQALRYSIARLRQLRALELPLDTYDFGTSYNSLSVCLSGLGRDRWAERFSAIAVQIAERNSTIANDGRAAWLKQHGVALFGLARKSHGVERARLFVHARARFHAALRLVRETQRRSREAAICLDALAGLHNAQERLGAATVLNRAALSMRRDVLPAVDTELAVSLFSLGAVLLRRGKLNEARRLLGEALAIWTEIFSNSRHPGRVGTAVWLAAAHLLAGDVAAAEVLVRAYADDLAMDKVGALSENIRRGWQ